MQLTEKRTNGEKVNVFGQKEPTVQTGRNAAGETGERGKNVKADKEERGYGSETDSLNVEKGRKQRE